MPVPESLDPFAQETIYDKYGIDPHADLAEISQRLRQVTAELDALGADERAERIADLQQALNRIKNHRLRVLLNAHLLDPLDNRKVLEVLGNLPRPRDDDVSLPALGLSQMLTEGECPAFSEEDFREVTPESKLQLDFSDVQKHLDERAIERYIVFDS